MTDPARVTDPAYVAEQTGVVVHAEVTDAPLEPLLAGAKRTTATEAMGALVTFEGIVRDHDGGAAVTALTYTAHPQATDFMRDVVESVVSTHPEVRAWAAQARCASGTWPSPWSWPPRTEAPRSPPLRRSPTG